MLDFSLTMMILDRSLVLCFCLNGGAVSWRSSKQDIVADSTTESEYIAASDAAKEAVWLKKFITGLDVVPNIANPVDLHCDSIVI